MHSDRPDVQAILDFLSAPRSGFDAWHDGHGYPLDALGTMNAATREALARSVVVRGWREVQLLAVLDMPVTRAALRSAFDAAGVARCEIGLALLRWCPDCLSEDERTELVCNALECAQGGAGLDGALVAAQDWHSEPVVEALWHALDGPDPTVVVHIAALLYYLYGIAAEPFDWSQRRDFLRFASEDVSERMAARTDLRTRIAARTAAASGLCGTSPPGLKRGCLP